MKIGQRILALAMLALLAGGCGDGGDDVAAVGAPAPAVGEPAGEVPSALSEAELVENPSLLLQAGQVAVMTPETASSALPDTGPVGKDTIRFRVPEKQRAADDDEIQVNLGLELDGVAVEIVPPWKGRRLRLDKRGKTTGLLGPGEYQLVVESPRASAQGDLEQNPPALFADLQAGLRGALAFRVTGVADGLNLSGSSLLGVNFSGTSLAGTIFDGCGLDGALFDGATLTGASLRKASLRTTSFAGADLNGAYFDGAKGQGVNFTGAALDLANLDNGSLPGSRLVGLKSPPRALRDVDLTSSVFSGSFDTVKIERCNLSGCRFKDSTWRNARILESTVDEANFADAQLIGATLNLFGRRTIFRGALLATPDGTFKASFVDGKLTGPDFAQSPVPAHFEGTEFVDANFSGSQLSFTTFSTCKFARANFSRAVTDRAQFLSCTVEGAGTTFEQATLRFTNFRESDFSGVSFRRAVFSTGTLTRMFMTRLVGADFRDTAFDQIAISQCDLSRAIGPDGAIFPEGTIK